MNKLIFPLLAITLIACSGPKSINVQNGDEKQLNCQQLAYEIQSAEQAKKDAHADDHFKFSHMFNYAFVYKVWAADSAATKRIKNLTEIFNQKGCASNTSGNMQYPDAPQAPYQMPVPMQPYAQ